MSKIYLAFIVEEDGKFYSFFQGIAVGNNLLPILKEQQNLKVAHVCENKKRAAEIVTIWNDGYRTNGTYLFDDPNLF